MTSIANKSDFLAEDIVIVHEEPGSFGKAERCDGSGKCRVFVVEIKGFEADEVVAVFHAAVVGVYSNSGREG